MSKLDNYLGENLMNRSFFFILLTMMAIKSMAISIDQAVMNNAKYVGTDIYHSCIINIPITPEQVAECDEKKIRYEKLLETLNEPLPLILTLYPSEYSRSIYDVCRYEISHLVFDVEDKSKLIPYCRVS
jgi:hypothetical protein